MANMMKSAFEFLKKTVWNAVHKDAAKMLIAMGAMGFAFSSMAQCFAIKINEKISNRKKKFLISQEAADGLVNIGLYLGITSGIWKVSDKLLKKLGVFNIKNSKGIIPKDEYKQLRSGGRIATTMIATVIACNIITPLIRNLYAGKITAYRDKKEREEKRKFREILNNNSTSVYRNFDNFTKNFGKELAFRANTCNPFKSKGMRV